MRPRCLSQRCENTCPTKIDKQMFKVALFLRTPGWNDPNVHQWMNR